VKRLTLILLSLVLFMPARAFSQNKMARAAHSSGKFLTRKVSQAGDAVTNAVSDCFRSKLMAVECAIIVGSSVWDAKSTLSCASHVTLPCYGANLSLSSRPSLVQVISVGMSEDLALLASADAVRGTSPVSSVLVLVTPVALHVESIMENDREVRDLRNQGVLK
jgi:hypothetical protein